MGWREFRRPGNPITSLSSSLSRSRPPSKYRRGNLHFVLVFYTSRSDTDLRFARSRPDEATRGRYLLDAGFGAKATRGTFRIPPHEFRLDQFGTGFQASWADQYK